MSTVTQKIPAIVKPELGFLGVGWIGHDRMRAVVEDEELATAAFICDPSAENCLRAMDTCPQVRNVATLEEMLASDVDGIVIATPSALHAEQSLRVLESGKAVFCQKPLGRDRNETHMVVEAARRNDQLLGVDHSYRHTRVVRRLHEMIRNGELGDIHSVELVFHNAYGPDKPWFYDPRQSGGGCMMDLGIHLIDLLIMLFEAPLLRVEHTNILAGGKRIGDRQLQVEDHAEALLRAGNGMLARIVTSWNAPIGKDADIRVEVLGTAGGASIRNVDGSFYDLRLTRHEKNHGHVLVDPPDAWGGRALKEWTRKLAAGEGFDPQCEQYLAAAGILDRIYAWNG